MRTRSLTVALCAACLIACSGEATDASPAPNAGGTSGTNAGASDAAGGVRAQPEGGAGASGSGSGSGSQASGAGHAGNDPTPVGVAGSMTADAGRELDAATSDVDDRATLLSCDVPEPCEATSVYLIENQPRYGADTQLECVLRALSLRTPGRYMHRTGATWSNGGSGADHALIVEADGTALYSRVSHGSLSPSPQEPLIDLGSPPTGQRCTLKPASYFEACLAQIMDEASAGADEWMCRFGSGDSGSPSILTWVQDCEDASPLACP